MNHPFRMQAAIRRYCLIGECTLELLRARQALLHRPFEKTAKSLQEPLSQEPAVTQRNQVVREVRGAMGGIRRRIPWTPTCLMRAIAARRVLARRGVPSRLILAVAPTSGVTVDAHAWLEAEGMVVTGQREKSRYAPIYTFDNAKPARLDGIREDAQGGQHCSR